MDNEIPRTWLVERLTVEEAERRNPSRIDDERLVGHPELGRPFGGLHQQWDKLKAQMLPGDEIWTFESPSDSWEQFAGRSGLALLRDGRVIASFATLMS